ncbi:amidase [Alicyclobacillus fastidiosus]|uniref:Amidase n=1 Tax=Alicyclobacillus fastidiosus TaxID=392011 RepID=A0ABY6ZGI3_9BACL|nr:amidase [Alicyclobacillus fastidiosus]WAH41201.1 amidase [Alicyclobacillus fastidiosus]GMA62779.1 amidase [Alicyclobacillus fastidiosus]
MSEQLSSKSIEQLAPLLRDKAISPVDVTQAVIHQTEQLDGKLNAYIRFEPEAALAAAKAAELDIVKGNYRGPLHGIPMAIKDIFYFQGEVATIGSNIHRDFVPEYDATVIAKLREAGVVYTGTLNLHEYAFGGTTNNPHFGACHNPWDLARIPGGSSGGSAAAVAADLTIASLGTDTAGSVRIPATFCGIVGLKPTHGLVSKYGVFPLAWSLDHVGPMTKTVWDAAVLMEYMTGYDENDPTSRPSQPVAYTQALRQDVEGLVIGVEEDYFFAKVDSLVAQTVRRAIHELQTMGATVQPVCIPTLAQAVFAETVTVFAEASAIHHHHLQTRRDEFGDDVRISLEQGELLSAVDYLLAQQVRTRLKAEFTQVFNDVDVLIAPSMPMTAPRIGEHTLAINGRQEAVFDLLIRQTQPANLTGYPSLTVPCGFVDGLPVGMQIMGPAFREDLLLRVGYAYEKATPYASQRPNLDLQQVSS